MLGAVCGCQSNSEADYIARDRRMREDQIYALQDYIQQYQQLVCQYRSENATLRRQVSEGYVVEPQRNNADPYTPSRTTPKFQSPQTPANKKTPSSLPATQPETPAIEEPAVPPLKMTSEAQSIAEPDLSIAAKTKSLSSPQVLRSSFEEPVDTGGATSEAAPPTQNSNACDVMICGEVVANDSGGGPRLLIDVVPFDKSGRVESFNGNLSLVMTGAGDDGKQARMCGWDFGPEDVHAAVDTNAAEPSMRFYVELPAEATIDRPSILWARLVPSKGSKLFAHAKIDLVHPSVFASHANKSQQNNPQQSQEPAVATEAHDLVVPTNYEEPPLLPQDELADVPRMPSEEPPVTAEVSAADESPPTAIAVSENEGAWAVAAPGKPANLPREARDESGAGGWRASSEPIPAAIVASTEVPAPQKIEPMHKPLDRLIPVEAKATVVRPNWAPARGGEPRRGIATRPGWWATR
jgi:hypothetical protein